MLRSCSILKDCSKSRVFRSSSVTDANYDTARKTRYSKKQLIVRRHIQAMMSFPPLTQESAEGIRQLWECFQENTLSLSTHTSRVVHWDTILFWAISEKLDSETRKWLELAHPGKNLQLLEDVLKFLDERSRALEAQSLSSRVCSPVKQQILQTSRRNQPSRNRNLVYGKTQLLDLGSTAKVNKKLITAPAEIVTAVAKFISSSTVLATAR